MKRCYTHKGFTLVELLIVIVVIGILTAMMSLGASEFIASAKVSVIVGNMTQIKKAALSWYMDNFDLVDADGRLGYPYAIFANETKTKVEDIQTYLSGWEDQKGKIKSSYSNQRNFRTYLESSATTLRINVKNADNSYGTSEEGDYALINGKRIGDVGTDSKKANKIWYISYRVAKTDNDNLSLQNKLKGRAEQLGLLGKNGKTYSGGMNVFMRVIKFAD